MTAAVCVGGSLAFAKSPEPTDLPDTRRLIVTPLPVGSGEFMLYDAVAVAARSDGIDIAVPDPFAGGIAPRIYVAEFLMPTTRRVRTTARRRAPEIGPTIEPLAMTLVIRRPGDVAELKMPEMSRLHTATSRPAPEIDQTVEPPPMTVPTRKPGRGANVSLRHVQSLLKGRGYDPGPADGIIGQRTRSAIASFKADMASAVTLSVADRGLLDMIRGLPK